MVFVRTAGARADPKKTARPGCVTCRNIGIDVNTVINHSKSVVGIKLNHHIKKGICPHVINVGWTAFKSRVGAKRGDGRVGVAGSGKGPEPDAETAASAGFGKARRTQRNVWRKI